MHRQEIFLCDICGCVCFTALIQAIMSILFADTPIDDENTDFRPGCMKRIGKNYQDYGYNPTEMD